jgi:hypothetical protein
MGNATVSKMNKKDSTTPKTLRTIAKREPKNSGTTVPRTIVRRGPNKIFRNPQKENPQTDMDAVTVAPVVFDGEGERKVIQKTKKIFRHFVFTEPSPAISPSALIHKALNVLPGVFRYGTSYVLYAHDPASYVGSCSHVRGSTGYSIHYHLLMRSNDPDLETTLIKKAADAFVYVENSFYQIPVQCPLTTYATLRQDAVLLEMIGGDIFDSFERVLQRGVLKPLTRVNIEPVWEAHKQSQILAQEQLIALVNAGPYRTVFSQILGALVNKTGSVSSEQNGWHITLECGRSLSAYQTQNNGIEASSYLDESQLPPPTQVAYSTAGLAEEEPNPTYEYAVFPQTVMDDYYAPQSQVMDCDILPPQTPSMDYAVVMPQTQTMGYESVPQTQEYDLLEDLLQDPDESTPEEELDAVIRSFSTAHDFDYGPPKPSASAVDFF